jgi:hypothetical protein
MNFFRLITVILSFVCLFIIGKLVTLINYSINISLKLTNV